MAKGNAAKEAVIAKIKAAFGDKYLGEKDKKVYVLADDAENGEMQIALTLVCPSKPIPLEEFDNAATSKAAPDLGFEWGEVTPTSAPQLEITEEEQENIDRLMKMFDL